MSNENIKLAHLYCIKILVLFLFVLGTNSYAKNQSKPAKLRLNNCLIADFGKACIYLDARVIDNPDEYSYPDMETNEILKPAELKIYYANSKRHEKILLKPVSKISKILEADSKTVVIQVDEYSPNGWVNARTGFATSYIRILNQKAKFDIDDENTILSLLKSDQTWWKRVGDTIYNIETDINSKDYNDSQMNADRGFITRYKIWRRIGHIWYQTIAEKYGYTGLEEGSEIGESDSMLAKFIGSFPTSSSHSNILNLGSNKRYIHTRNSCNDSISEYEVKDIFYNSNGNILQDYYQTKCTQQVLKSELPQETLDDVFNDIYLGLKYSLGLAQCIADEFNILAADVSRYSDESSVNKASGKDLYYRCRDNNNERF